MKKLKGWQIVLLVIFYPVGIIYLVVWLLNRSKVGTEAESAAPERLKKINEKQAGKMHVLREYVVKLAGVTFGNDDGSSRQKILASCTNGAPLALARVEVKDHPEAIGVFLVSKSGKIGKQLGYLPEAEAKRLIQEYPNNQKQANIDKITGGNGKNYGCNVRLVIYSETM